MSGEFLNFDDCVSLGFFLKENIENILERKLTKKEFIDFKNYLEDDNNEALNNMLSDVIAIMWKYKNNRRRKKR